MRYINKSRFFILVSLLTLLFSFSISYAKNTGDSLASSLVRLHIVANSNKAADQKLKLAVRDRLIKETSAIFENSQSPEDALISARNNTDLIRRIAKDEILRHGFSYDVNVKIGKFAFPSKAYADIMLPAGKYNAIRIEIGSGSGENWWCVMYPPLCFTDGIVSISDESRQKLKENLSQEEYSLITSQNSGTIPVQFKFKIVEIFQNFFA